MKELINRKINKVSVYGDYQDYIGFDTDDGFVIYFADGDCCSCSYFSEIWNIKNILGKTITDAKEIDLVAGEAPFRESRQEEDSIYGIRIYAGDDVCTIIFRNSSNGYYGGSINNADTIPATELAVENKVLEDNWSAPSL